MFYKINLNTHKSTEILDDIALIPVKLTKYKQKYIWYLCQKQKK